jgi:hypothetical protein
MVAACVESIHWSRLVILSQDILKLAGNCPTNSLMSHIIILQASIIYSIRSRPAYRLNYAKGLPDMQYSKQEARCVAGKAVKKKLAKVKYCEYVLIFTWLEVD